MKEEILKKLENFDKDSYYIVGVSGGCDSMCLLDLLVKAKLKIAICHVNYNLREDTMEDYQVVYQYAVKHHIPFHYKEVEEYDNDNFQQFARHVRYDFYREVGKQYQTNKVFLGHHKDDVLETILMQKERNNKQLYWGIKEKSEVRGNIVYRVMLEITKKEILEYCHFYHIPYHDDYTNFETHFKRDYIRNVILPKMSLQEKERLLLEAKQHNQELFENENKYREILDRVLRNERLYFKEIPEPFLEGVLRIYLRQYIPVKRISKALIKEFCRMLKNNQPNCELSLPVNLRFIKEYDNGYIQSDNLEVDYCYQFECFEQFECPYFKLESSGHLNEGVYLHETDFPITIRNFKEGDKVHTKVGHKKVNRLFIDRKIPVNQRRRWPILLNREGKILLIPNIVKNFQYMDTKANVFVVK